MSKPPSDSIRSTRPVSPSNHAIASDRMPEDTAWLFPEYAFEELDLSHHAGVIIERILDRGTWEQLRWLFACYGEKRVADWVMRHGFRLLSKRSFALWRLALDIEVYAAPDWAIAAKRTNRW